MFLGQGLWSPRDRGWAGGMSVRSRACLRGRGSGFRRRRIDGSHGYHFVRFFAGADADGTLDIGHDELAITDLAGTSGLTDTVDDTVDILVCHV